jgi:uncharacterized protein YbbC (DUF1343 family)/CubicO group peptidase (beta-lactamase class C family)
MKRILIFLALAAACAGQARFAGSENLDRILNEAVEQDQVPGAVLLVGQPGRQLHYAAYGQRALEPAREPMTLDTIFDVASLTKVVATTTSVMRLVEEGRVRLASRVTDYLPKFQGGKSDITVRQLLTHFSGLRPDVDLKPPWSGYDTGVQLALVDKPVASPGERFIYSDINFVLLGEIVRVVSGKPLDEYARDHLFAPLGMTETAFRPPAAWRSRIAPTERVDGQLLRGIVHDPTARYMGGVAGHAGLFSTARDLARWCEMLLGMGEVGGVRLLQPLTVQKFIEPNSPAFQMVQRGLGFDLDSPYSSNRGELFPIGSYGHTGFTGTSVWIDPATKTYVILLANSVHPKLRPAISALRSRVATVVAAALGVDAPGMLLTGYVESGPEMLRRPLARSGQVLTGLDVLVEEKFARLRGKRVGLITNHTGLTRDGKRNIDVMLAAGVRLTALFSPEHGLQGRDDQEDVAHGKDAASGLAVWSLYRGEERKPSPAMLREVDVLVFDIQDIGARFYTYISTLRYALEAAAQAKLPVIVLDRPNPITGAQVEGPMIDRDLISFVGCAPIPLRHGMTIGEMGLFLNEHEGIRAPLEVVAMRGWRRGDWWDSTGLPWVNPSPNMRSLTAALLYPGVAMLEYAKNWSVGRGTDAPFEQTGADWINGSELAGYLNRRAIPGVRFYATRFTPSESRFAGKAIEGIRFVILERDQFSSARLGLELAAALERLYPGQLDLQVNAKLIGSQAVIDGLKAGADPRTLQQSWAEVLAEFWKIRRKYLLYQ